MLIVCALPVFAEPGVSRWQSVNTRGMGFVSGGVVNPLPPYHLYVRTDVGGAYRLDRQAQRWVPLNDAFSVDFDYAMGIESIATDPQQPQRVAVAVPWRKTIEFSPEDGYDVDYYSAEVLISADAGSTWQPSGLSNLSTRIETGPNSLFRGETGERLAFDPRRSDIIYFATRSDGLWRKVGSSEWELVTGGLPDPATLPGIPGEPSFQFLFNRPGYTFVVFAPEGPGAPPGTASSTIYTGVWGSGVWRSTDAGATWSRVSTRPYPVRASMSPTGTLYVSEHENSETGGLSKIVPQPGGTVTVSDITPTVGATVFNRGYGGITVDPKDPNIVFATYMYGYSEERWGLFRSTDGGQTWTEIVQSAAQMSGDRPGYYLPIAGDWGRGTLLFDPADPSAGFTRTVFAGNGFGVVQSDQIGTSSAPTWRWLMNNLEEGVAIDVAVTTKPRAEGGPAVLFSFADVLGFSMHNPLKTPLNTIVPIVGFPVPEGSSIDFSWGRPDYVTFLGHNDSGFTPYSALSTDGGRTFGPFPSVVNGAQGGRMALATNDGRNIVWLPSSYVPAHYTTDGGVTWTLCADPVPSDPGDTDTALISWQVANQSWKGQVLAASPVLANTFYLWSYGRLMVSTDAGANWYARYAWFNPGAGDVPEAWAIDSAITPHPERPNEIWLTTKPNRNQTFQSGPYRSTDGGWTFDRLESVVHANYLAFGKGYQSGQWVIYIHGKVEQNGQIREGVFRSLSDGAAGSWEFIGPPGNTFPGISGLAADPREPGIVYVITGGRGAFAGRIAPPLPCTGDVNNDGVVNFTDLTRVLTAFGDDAAFFDDVTCDNRLNFADITQVLLGFGGRCW